MNFSVVIPAYNAAGSLRPLIERTLPYVPPHRIVVIDDGSVDETSVVATSFGVLLRTHEKNRGKGAALQTGFSAVTESDSDAAITMDADLQHQPEEIPKFISAFADTGCDIIIGNRLHDTTGMPLHRRFSNTVTTALVGLRTGADVADSQCGFRLLSRRVITNIRLEATGFEAETELLIKAARSGCTFGSVPIRTIYAGEKSHMTHVATTIKFLQVLLRQY